MGEDLPAGYRAQFLPDLVESRRRMGADKPAQAAVKNIRSPVPGRAQSARERTRFKNLGLQAVHLQVAAARETGDAAADDDDLTRSEEHTSELQSLTNLVCRL